MDTSLPPEPDSPIAKFVGLFRAAPARISHLFVALSIACLDIGSRVTVENALVEMPDLDPPFTEAEATEVLVAARAFVDQTGDDESWREFEISYDELRRLVAVGARTWIEEKIARALPAPAPPPPAPIPVHLSHEYAEQLAEQQEEARVAAVFDAFFLADPARVAALFVGLALASAAAGGYVAIHDILLDTPDNVTAFDEAEGEAILAAARGFVEQDYRNDGDGEGACDEGWTVFYLKPETQQRIATTGAQRWVEEQLGRVRPPPPVAGVSRAEMEMYAVRHQNEGVDQIIAALGGHGTEPRQVDRGALAEVLLALALLREAKLGFSLNVAQGRISQIGHLGGQIQMMATDPGFEDP